MANTHRFKETTFRRPTYCEKCGGLLWGLVRQGLECSECGYAFHRECKAGATQCSRNKNTVPQNESAATKSLRQLQEKNLDSATSNRLENVIVSAAVNAADESHPSNAYLASMPPLNPHLTARNFTRFVSRCGPMFTFRDSVILLLSWDKPVDTLIAMIAYCMICLYPKLILFVPQIALFHVIMQAYPKRPRRDAESNSPTAPTPTSPQIQASSSLSASLQAPSASTSANKRGTFISNFAAALFPNWDESSPEYSRNLQNLQNLMGEVSDLHDLVLAHLHYINWTSEEKTKALLQGLLFSSFGLAIVVYFVPLNLIFLTTGVAVFTLNTRFAKFMIQELAPQITELGRTQLSVIIERYKQYEKQVNQEQIDNQENVQEISLFENQRSFPGSGYVPQDQTPWSDASGAVEKDRKEDLSAPKGFRWVGTDWALDTTGPWKDNGRETAVVIEEGGWVYTKDRAVRRRRWIRQCERQVKKNKRPRNQ